MISDADLLQAVKEETSEALDVYGEVGRDDRGCLALLALERASSALVLLLVTTTTGGEGDVELGIELQSELAPLPADVVCASCGSRLRPGGRFCPDCGLEAVVPKEATDLDPVETRAAVEESISGGYRLLGDMQRTGGGRVYFAQELSSGRITMLRLSQSTPDSDLELVETRAV